MERASSEQEPFEMLGVHTRMGHNMAEIPPEKIEAGASLIIGRHSHIRHGVERYRNGVILYSLGDFVFHDGN
jgi:poly-gamma-glutamate synthesis protein (capsule biosynthesis protein)